MVKRFFDIAVAVGVCLVFGIPICLLCILIFSQDWRSPLYIARRVGKNNRMFLMFKLRTMSVAADKSGLMSTADTDSRITPLGKHIRRFKFDEIPQFINVLNGTMSVVGPRPNVAVEVENYTKAEQFLLSVKPGITDVASIVFSDEGKILADLSNADEGYNKYIRPYKNRLAIAYINKASLVDDFYIVLATARNSIDRAGALKMMHKLAVRFGVEKRCLDVLLRNTPLQEWRAP